MWVVEKSYPYLLFLYVKKILKYSISNINVFNNENGQDA